MNIFITGVSKGIGLALTIEALNRGDTVYGLARKPEESQKLIELQKKFSQLKLIKLDLLESHCAENLTKGLKDCLKIDILINNAGIYEKDTTKDAFMKSFEVNSYIPFMVTNCLLSKLKSAVNPKVVHITSLMGSIEDNTSGDSYAYRASKTALNMIHKCLTLEHDWLLSAAIHPGWVQTDMGGSSAPTSVEASALGIWKVIEELRPKDSGCFKDFQG